MGFQNETIKICAFLKNKFVTAYYAVQDYKLFSDKHCVLEECILPFACRHVWVAKGRTDFSKRGMDGKVDKKETHVCLEVMYARPSTSIFNKIVK